jgi:hypothetical protein
MNEYVYQITTAATGRNGYDTHVFRLMPLDSNGNAAIEHMATYHAGSIHEAIKASDHIIRELIFDDRKRATA